jgi:hypothetical protein
VYAGHLTGYKRPTISLKSNKRPSRLPEEWETVKNTHEGIVSEEVFDTVQKLITSRRGKHASGYDNVFSGVVKCADCGGFMAAKQAHRHKGREIVDCIVYMCGDYIRNGRSSCSAHTVEARDLHEAVIADINHFAGIALNDPKAVKAIQQKLNAMDTREVKAYEREKRRLSKRLSELDKLFSALFEDTVMERVSERNYSLMREKYEKEQADIDGRLREIDAGLTAKGLSDRGAADFLSLVGQYQGIRELTAATVNALIDRITVTERTKDESGSVEQRIKIYYKFVGHLQERPIAVQRRLPQIPQKACERCGQTYTPGSNIARYCPVCRGAVRRDTAARTYKRRAAVQTAESLAATT